MEPGRFIGGGGAGEAYLKLMSATFQSIHFISYNSIPNAASSLSYLYRKKYLHFSLGIMFEQNKQVLYIDSNFVLRSQSSRDN